MVTVGFTVEGLVITVGFTYVAVGWTTEGITFGVIEATFVGVTYVTEGFITVGATDSTFVGDTYAAVGLITVGAIVDGWTVLVSYLTWVGVT